MKRLIPRKFAAWLALFAITLNALWPLAASAKPGHGSLLVTVCGQAAPAVIDLGPGKSAPPDFPGSAHTQPHCPLCSLGGHGAAPLPASFPAVAAQNDPSPIPQAHGKAWPRQHVFEALPAPRAPPRS